MAEDIIANSLLAYVDEYGLLLGKRWQKKARQRTLALARLYGEVRKDLQHGNGSQLAEHFESLCNVLDSVASPLEEGAVVNVVLSFIKRNHFEEVFLPVLRSGVRPAQVLALRQARRRCMCCTTDLVLREILRAAAPLLLAPELDWDVKLQLLGHMHELVEDELAQKQQEFVDEGLANLGFGDSESSGSGGDDDSSLARRALPEVQVYVLCGIHSRVLAALVASLDTDAVPTPAYLYQVVGELSGYIQVLRGEEFGRYILALLQQYSRFLQRIVAALDEGWEVKLERAEDGCTLEGGILGLLADLAQGYPPIAAHMRDRGLETTARGWQDRFAGSPGLAQEIVVLLDALSRAPAAHALPSQPAVDSAAAGSDGCAGRAQPPSSTADSATAERACTTPESWGDWAQPQPASGTWQKQGATLSGTDMEEAAGTLRCATCGVDGIKIKLQQCGGCGGAWYCGRACQRAQWPQHKAACKRELQPQQQHQPY